MNPTSTRRDILRVGSVLFANGALAALEPFLAGCAAVNKTSSSSSSSSSSTDTSSSSSSTSCSEATNVTRGPYFVDDRKDANITNDVVDTNIPERSDIRSDSEGSGGTQSGLPLALSLYVGAWDSTTQSCSVLEGAQVHIWHCNALGVYSDVQASTNGGGADLTGEDFLRGYQYSDADGKVSFTTIYPGWYSGRAVHIHVKVRVFDSSGNVTTEATTQLFFNDDTTTAVYAANSAYSRSGSRDTLNSNDSIYSEEDPALLVSLSGSTSAGYTGTVSIGVIKGTIYGG